MKHSHDIFSETAINTEEVPKTSWRVHYSILFCSQSLLWQLRTIPRAKEMLLVAFTRFTMWITLSHQHQDLLLQIQILTFQFIKLLPFIQHIPFQELLPNTIVMLGTGLDLFQRTVENPTAPLYHSHYISKTQSLLINSFPITYNPKKTVQRSKVSSPKLNKQ